MRICIINEFFHPDSSGGTGTVLSSLVRHLSEQYPDVSVEVITTRSLYRDEEQVLARHEWWNGVQIFRIGVPRPRNARMMPRLSAGLLFSLGALLKLARRPRYDCVLVTTAPPTLPLATQLGRWITRAPYIYIIYDLFPDVPVALGTLASQGRIARVCRRFQGRWLRSASKVVVLGRCMRDHLTAQYGLAVEKMEVIPIWSDHSAQPLGTRTKFRHEHGLSGPVVLYAGNFGQCQDFDTLLDAAREMRQRKAPGTWVFVGAGDKKEHIERRIEEEKLSNVRMFPFVPQEEFADLLASADISLVTLEPGAEGLGVPSKFYNILASGRATVAVVSRGSEVARVLEEENCGVVVAHGDVAHLAATISSLAADTPRRHRMGQAARQAFESQYTIERAGQRFHNLLLQVAARSAAASRATVEQGEISAVSGVSSALGGLQAGGPRCPSASGGKVQRSAQRDSEPNEEQSGHFSNRQAAPPTASECAEAIR